jgi:hypothetical protein
VSPKPFIWSSDRKTYNLIEAVRSSGGDETCGRCVNWCRCGNANSDCKCQSCLADLNYGSECDARCDVNHCQTQSSGQSAGQGSCRDDQSFSYQSNTYGTITCANLPQNVGIEECSPTSIYGLFQACLAMSDKVIFMHCCIVHM